MDKESLISKNEDIEELKQTPEDMYVEHNSSGSDNDNSSEISLTVEDGTKDLTKNKEISVGDKEDQDLQNLANYFEKSSEDTDEENVDENQDFCDKDDQEDQNSANLEENQDDAENNEQDEDLNTFEEEYNKLMNIDPDKGIINEAFLGANYVLSQIIDRDYPEEYMLDLNVNRCITKDVSDRSMGLRVNKEPYMFIFTITKKFTLTCEVYLEYYEGKFTEYIKDLLRVTHHIYFIGVTEENSNKFDRFWNDMSINFFENENKINIESDFYKINHNINLRSMIFIPHRPRATISHVFTNKTFEITALQI